MLIGDDLFLFCAEKVRLVSAEYDRDCGAEERFPRNHHTLHHIVHGHCDRPIHHCRLPVDRAAAKYRSFYIPLVDRVKIFYASGLSEEEMLYYKTKELLQILLWQESTRTEDVVDLVQNMIVLAGPASRDLELGHAATADTLGEIAAMEFLLPHAERVEFLRRNPANNGVAELAREHGIPAFAAQRAFANMKVLEEFFGPGAACRAEGQ